MVSVDGAISSVIAAKQGAVQTQIGIAVLAKQQEATQQQGDAVNALLAAAAQMSKALGKGAGFDAVG